MMLILIITIKKRYKTKIYLTHDCFLILKSRNGVMLLLASLHMPYKPFDPVIM